MRSVVVAACLLAGIWLAVPARAAAQDPDPAPQPPPAAEPRPQVDGRNRAPERAVERPAREAGTERGAAGREVVTGDAAVPRPAAAAEATGDADQRGQRPGSVRRPPSGGDRDRTGDRAVPRGTAPSRPAPSPRTGGVYRGYPYRWYPNYSLYYDPWGYGSFGLGYFYYAPWTWGPYAYNYGYGYGYGYPSYPRFGGSFGFDAGSVKLKVRPHDAEVWVDGYYAGIVDDFDGAFQALKLDSGPYRIEIRKPGYETLTFDVRVQPDRTITFRGEMKQLP